MKTDWDYTNLAEAYLKRPNYSDEAIDKMLELAEAHRGGYRIHLRCGSRRGTSYHSAPESRAFRRCDRAERCHARQWNSAHRAVQKREVVRGSRRAHRTTFGYFRSGHVRFVIRRLQSTGSIAGNATYSQAGRMFRLSLESSRPFRRYSKSNRKHHQKPCGGLRLRQSPRRSNADH